MSIGFRHDYQHARWPMIAIALLILACAIVSCQQKRAEQGNSASATRSQAESAQPANVKYHHGVGIIKKVTPQDPSVEIDHEEIKGYMAAMRMEYQVKDKSLLDSIQPGDKVDFTVEEKQGVEVISEIKKQ